MTKLKISKRKINDRVDLELRVLRKKRGQKSFVFIWKFHFQPNPRNHTTLWVVLPGGKMKDAIKGGASVPIREGHVLDLHGRGEGFKRLERPPVWALMKNNYSIPVEKAVRNQIFETVKSGGSVYDHTPGTPAKNIKKKTKSRINSEQRVSRSRGSTAYALRETLENAVQFLGTSTGAIAERVYPGIDYKKLNADQLYRCLCALRWVDEHNLPLSDLVNFNDFCSSVG